MNVASVVVFAVVVLALGVAGVVIVRRVQAYVAGVGWAARSSSPRRR